MQPSSSPTTSPKPTPSPTVKFGPVAGAQLVYSVFFKGDTCKSAPLGFALKSAFPLDQCLVSNSPVTQYHPYTLGCKAGLDRLSVVKTLYTDFACSQEQPPATDVVLYHVDPGCAPVKKTVVSPGPFSETQCTASLPYDLWNREQVVLQAYRSPSCVGALSDDGGNPEVVSYFLGMCYAMSRTEWRRLTYVSGDGIASDIVLHDRRYPDATCSGALRPSTIHVTFPATDGTACQANPLQPLSYYAGAFRSLSLREDSREWVGLFPTAFGGLPSSAPTNSPTSAPTVIPDGGQTGPLCQFFNTVPVSQQGKLTNWCTTPFNPCQAVSPWRGVTCSSFGSLSRVTSINLHDLFLDGGRLPSSIGELSLLTVLDLGGAEIGKQNPFPLPSTLGLLTNLQRLDLGGARFDRSIPTELGLLRALTYLGLDGPSEAGMRSMYGRIPTQLRSLTALKVLKLNNNRLTSTIPTFFGSPLGLTSLTSLQLGGNSFTGQVPSSLCALTSTVTLDVSGNSLGCAPACLFSVSFSSVVLEGVPQCLTDTVLDGAALCDLKTAAVATASLSDMGGWCSGSGPYNPCGWNGITCTSFDGTDRVTKIVITGDKDHEIIGSLPTTLARLDKLVELTIAQNLFFGSLPSYLGTFAALTKLDFSSNSFGGTVPPSLGLMSSLVELDLSANNFAGSLPPTLGQLSALTRLSVGFNSLIGPLPMQLYSLMGLQRLSLSNNALTGTLSGSVGNLAALTSLAINANSFGGSLPAALAQLGALRVLDVQNNRFTGTLAASVVSSLSSLQILSLGSNSLRGSLPSELGGLSGLKNLTLSYNAFTGAAPASLCRLPRTASIQFVSTSISCKFSCLANPPFTNLLSTVLAACDVGLVEGSALCELYSLSHNKPALTNWCGAKNAGGSYINPPCSSAGSIKRWAGVNCTTLQGTPRVTRLAMVNVGLSGALPSSLGNLGALTFMSLGANSLGGSVPSTIAQLTALLSLDLGNNLIGSSLPSSMQTMSRLQLLHLGGNALVGTVPAWVSGLSSLTNLDLSFNSFVGALPPTLGLMTKLDFLALGGNRLSRSLPPALGQLSKVKSLLLSSNAFTGPVPSSLCALTAIVDLQLQQNPGLACFPPCFTAVARIASALQKDATANCSSAPTPAPAAPTPAPSAWPTAAVPTQSPSSPTLVPTQNSLPPIFSDFYVTTTSANASFGLAPAAQSQGRVYAFQVADAAAASPVSSASASFRVTPRSTVTLSYLVVGGGGGGGAWGGGGGGGQVQMGTVTLLGNTTYTVTVGNGGRSTPMWGSSTKGGDSSIVGGAVNLMSYGGSSGFASTRSYMAGYYVSPLFLSLSASTLVDTIPILPSSYEISFDLNLAALGSNALQNILNVGSGESQALPSLSLISGGSGGWQPIYKPSGGEEVRAPATDCTAKVAINDWMTVKLTVDTTTRLFTFSVTAAGTIIGNNYMAACSGSSSIASVQAVVGQAYTNVPIWTNYGASSINGQIRNLVVSFSGSSGQVTAAFAYGSGGGCWGSSYALSPSGCTPYSALSSSSSCSSGGNSCSGSGGAYTESSGGGGGAGGAGGEPTVFTNGNGGPGVSFLCTSGYYGGGGGGGANCYGRSDANTPGSPGTGGMGGGGRGGVCVTGASTASPLIKGANGRPHSGGGGGGGSYMFTSPTTQAVGTAGKGGSGVVLFALNLYCIRPPTMSPTLFTPLSIIFDWQARMAAAGTSVSDSVVTAAFRFFNTLTVGGLLPKISRLNLFSGQDLKAALLPLIYQSSTATTDTVVGGTFSYDQNRGVKTNNDAGWINTNQRISHVDQNDDNSAPSDGSNIHLSMFFMDPYPSCQSMGVWRGSGDTRNYVLTKWHHCMDWGKEFCTSSKNDAGMWAISSDTTKPPSSSSSPFFRMYCGLEQGAQCTKQLEGNGDGSTPSDWPVGLFAAYGSSNGCGPNAGQTYYENFGQTKKCTAPAPAGSAYSVCGGSMRVGGYSIGYALTQAEINVLNRAFIQYFNDIGRF